MFNDDKDFYTDTTGTATHLNSKTAIFNSLKEEFTLVILVRA